MRSLALAFALAALCACTDELPPYGQVLVVVDTDLEVPRFASAVRVDLYDPSGRWFESREFARPNADDWPLSFSVFSEDPELEKTVLVRLRIFPEGRARAYRGERHRPRLPYADPAPPKSLAEMCADPPLLTMGETRTLRIGTLPFLSNLQGGTCGGEPTAAGSVAAAFDVVEAGRYRAGITATTPVRRPIAMQLRTRCDDPGTALDCDSNLDVTAGVNVPLQGPTLTVDLQPGRYHLVTGGAFGGAAELELGVAREDAWETLHRPADPEASLPEQPRLIVGSDDRTPETEPPPDVAIDRLLLVRIRPGEVSSTLVVLRGACTGTQSLLSAAPPHQAVVVSEAQTCIDTEGERVPVSEAILESGSPAPRSSLRGQFAPSPPCPPAPLGRASEAVCVQGGAFLFGDQRVGVQERLAVMPSFWMDRYEMTVGEYRALESSVHLRDRAPFANDAVYPVAGDFDGVELCTYSTTSSLGREDWPLNCVSWEAARFICRTLGGDLPTEAQWEYAASAAGRAVETIYPWGDDAPRCVGTCSAYPAPCHEAVFARIEAALGISASDCIETGFGPLPVNSGLGDHADESLGPRVLGLAGNLNEYTLDRFEPLDSPCWGATGLVDPMCVEDDPPLRTARGSSWVFSSQLAPAVARVGLIPRASYANAGFRCVYGIEQP